MLILIVMTGLGLIFGVILAFANKKLAVEMNPLIHIVEDVLPKGQCGACGYAGCQAYAEAVVLNPDVPPNLCIPGKEVVAQAVAEITGKQAAATEPRMAHVRCNGTVGKAVFDFHYDGVKDCLAASLLQGGPKHCQYGCLGQGTCVAKCPFGALTLSEENLPVVNPARCTGCAVCAAVCPRSVIDMIPLTAHVEVDCNSIEKGVAAKQACSCACIACTLCVKNCPYGAIRMENNLPVVDHALCEEKCTDPTCVTKCPTKAILRRLSYKGE